MALGSPSEQPHENRFAQLYPQRGEALGYTLTGRLFSQDRGPQLEDAPKVQPVAFLMK